MATPSGMPEDEGDRGAVTRACQVEIARRSRRRKPTAARTARSWRRARSERSRLWITAARPRAARNPARTAGVAPTSPRLRTRPDSKGSITSADRRRRRAPRHRSRARAGPARRRRPRCAPIRWAVARVREIAGGEVTAVAELGERADAHDLEVGAAFGAAHGELVAEVERRCRAGRRAPRRPRRRSAAVAPPAGSDGPPRHRGRRHSLQASAASPPFSTPTSTIDTQLTAATPGSSSTSPTRPWRRGSRRGTARSR